MTNIMWYVPYVKIISIIAGDIYPNIWNFCWGLADVGRNARRGEAP